MLRRSRLDHLDEELRAHLEMRAADNLAAGMSPQQARYDAQKRFGNTSLLKEDTRNVDIVRWLPSLLSPSASAQTLRFSASLTPSFSARCPIPNQTALSASGSPPSNTTAGEMS